MPSLKRVEMSEIPSSRAQGAGLNRLIPHIKLHVWGGLGTQLYSILLARKLMQKFRGRKIKFYFHQSGVTKRFLQIPDVLLTGFDYKEISDFSKKKSAASSRRQFKQHLEKSFIKVVTTFLEKSGILARVNTEEEFNRLKPWVISIRGHYTGVKYSKEDLTSLKDCFQLHQFSASNRSIAVHFRLGDLIEIPNKTHTDPRSIFKVIAGLEQIPIDIFSDSKPFEVRKVLEVQNTYHAVRSIENLDIGETIKLCCNSGIFIGTNSKISVWIAIFRAIGNESRKTFLPSAFKSNLSFLLPEEDFDKLTFY